VFEDIPRFTRQGLHAEEDGHAQCPGGYHRSIVRKQFKDDSARFDHVIS
jgi:hypothetical protein